MASFGEFLLTFDGDMNRRGKQFERFVKWFLKNDPEWATQVQDVWLWDDYAKEYSHGNPPGSYKTADGYPLGQWVGDQRASYENLNDQRKARLEALGFVWAPNDAKWEEGFEHLTCFVKEHGHCRVPQRWRMAISLACG
jgi:Helicase associated domain